jgi:hypothetical protein
MIKCMKNLVGRRLGVLTAALALWKELFHLEISSASQQRWPNFMGLLDFFHGRQSYASHPCK